MDTFAVAKSGAHKALGLCARSTVWMAAVAMAEEIRTMRGPQQSEGYIGAIYGI